jgi:hypothetical protein
MHESSIASVGERITFECPNYCRGKMLSTSSAGVKACLNCGGIVVKEEPHDRSKFLRKLGVSSKTVEDGDSGLTAVEVAGVVDQESIE